MAIFFNRRDADGTHRIGGGGGSISSVSVHMTNIKAYLDIDENSFGIDRVPLEGSFNSTVLDSIQVIVNGIVLDESEYRFDVEEKVVIFNRHLYEKDLYVEVRSMLSARPSVILDDVLILPVCKYVKQRHLEAYLPDFGDKLGIMRIRGYEQNESILETIEEFNLAQVIKADVKEDGIYATVKFSIQ